MSAWQIGHLTTSDLTQGTGVSSIYLQRQEVTTTEDRETEIAGCHGHFAREPVRRQWHPAL